MSTSTTLVPLSALVAIAIGAGSAHAQSVPGFTVSTYANPTDPVLLSFGPDGTLCLHPVVEAAV